jgi:hypothetical protein
MLSHWPMGAMRVFQFPSAPKYCCVAKAQPLTLGPERLQLVNWGINDVLTAVTTCWATRARTTSRTSL